VFFARLFVTFVVLGTLFALVLVGVNAMSRVVQRVQAQEQDQTTRSRFMKGDLSSLQQRITDYEAYRSRQTDPDVLASDGRNLAVLYETLGKHAFDTKDFPLAETCFRRAIELDNDNPAYASDLGSLYAMTAESSSGQQKLQMLQESANQWERAVRTEPNVAKRQTYASGAAQTLYTYAESVAVFDPAVAREKLYRAREFAPPSSQIAADIEQFLNALTQR
jgi:tetratricopeptide (TPR) repeat protein